MSVYHKGKLRREIRMEDVTVIVDTREKRPFDLSPMRTKVESLVTGDYSIQGLEHEISIERKSLSDLLGCVGRDRDRFEKEIQRLLAYPVRAIFVEASIMTMMRGDSKSQITPEQVLGSLMGWAARGIPIIPAENPFVASALAKRFLFIAARRRYAQLVDFLDSQVLADNA